MDISACACNSPLSSDASWGDEISPSSSQNCSERRFLHWVLPHLKLFKDPFPLVHSAACCWSYSRFIFRNVFFWRSNLDRQKTSISMSSQIRNKSGTIKIKYQFSHLVLVCICPLVADRGQESIPHKVPQSGRGWRLWWSCSSLGGGFTQEWEYSFSHTYNESKN